MRALVGSDQTPTAIVDIGSRSTGVSFVEGGELKFAAQTDYAGASLTQALTSSLNINPRRAEELKRDKGIIASGAEYELSTVMLPYLDVIINEVKRADYSYHSQLPQARPIERVLLSGGGANLKGIEKYFKREFNLPVAKAAPLLKVQYPAPLEPVIGELNPVFSVAMGLAMREL
jgi:Tfp pilus assembly PilM family ATPase